MERPKPTRRKKQLGALNWADTNRPFPVPYTKKCRWKPQPHPPSPAASQPLVKELWLGLGQLPCNAGATGIEMAKLFRPLPGDCSVKQSKIRRFCGWKRSGGEKKKQDQHVGGHPPTCRILGRSRQMISLKQEYRQGILGPIRKLLRPEAPSPHHYSAPGCEHILGARQVQCRTGRWLLLILKLFYFL